MGLPRASVREVSGRQGTWPYAGPPGLGRWAQTGLPCSLPSRCGQPRLSPEEAELFEFHTLIRRTSWCVLAVVGHWASSSQLGLTHFRPYREALELFLLGTRAHFSPQDWNELAKCGKNRVLIILSFL